MAFTPFQIFGAVMAVTSGLSYMGSMKQMQNMQTAAKWDKYHEDIRKKYNTIQANERARKALNLKRAYAGARGVHIGEGSPLIEQTQIIKDYEDTLFWIEKGAEITGREIDFKLTSKLQATAWNTGTSLLTNLGSAYVTSKMSINQPNTGNVGHYYYGHT